MHGLSMMRRASRPYRLGFAVFCSVAAFWIAVEGEGYVIVSRTVGVAPTLGLGHISNHILHLTQRHLSAMEAMRGVCARRALIRFCKP